MGLQGGVEVQVPRATASAAGGALSGEGVGLIVVGNSHVRADMVVVNLTGASGPHETLDLVHCEVEIAGVVALRKEADHKKAVGEHVDITVRV